VARGEFEGRDGIWYVRRRRACSATRDPILSAAVAGVESALNHLQGLVELSERDADRVREALANLIA
jgi:hypothetical protein